MFFGVVLRSSPVAAFCLQTCNSQLLFIYGQKKKGTFQHSSFLAGGATMAAGRLIVKEGTLKVLVDKFCPTENLDRQV